MHLLDLIVKHQVEKQIGLTPEMDDLLATECKRFKATMSLEVSMTYLVLPSKSPVKS